MFPFPSFSLEFEIEMTTWQARLWTGYSMTKANPKSPSWRRRRATKNDSPWAQAFSYIPLSTHMHCEPRTDLCLDEWAWNHVSLWQVWRQNHHSTALSMLWEREGFQRRSVPKEGEVGYRRQMLECLNSSMDLSLLAMRKKEEEESFGQFKYQTSLSDGRELC